MKYFFSLKFKSLKAFFNHAHKGFTLIETIITVGVLAILLAVSIPSVITIQKNLKMQELDDIARQIFLSAQGELTEMKSSGRLETFKKELETTAPYPSQKLTQRPSDYDKVGTDSKWQEFYYLNDTDDIMQKHIIREVSSLGAYLEGGSFIVELNPKTGDVYGVFYSPKTGILYSNIIDTTKVPNRGRDGRVDAQIGYYGGEAGSSASSSLPANFLPTIEVINDEDLYLKFSCSNLQAVIRNQSFLKIIITAKDEHNDSWTKEFTGVTVTATGNTSYNILLDSLRPNESFAEITKLTAGDNITVTAILNYINKEDIINGETTIEFNSLFGSKKVDAVTGETQIDISKLRHLNNLRGSIYKEENLPTGEITLNQSLSIDFNTDNWKKSIDGKDVIMPTKLKPTLTSFSAIANKALLERNTGAEITYTGNGNSLLNFPLEASTTTPNENVGLFATAKNMTFSGMRLIDFSVDNAAYNNVGMLVGTLTSGKVIDVQAHLSTKDVNGLHHGTNMQGRLEKYNIKANNYVGGLIGVASGTTEIEGSFAAVPITATNNVGGLVGSFAGGTITNSYGSGNIIASSHAGGLVGLILGSTDVISCYSTSNVTANSYAGGLVGQTTVASTFTNGRSYGLVIKSKDAIDNATSGGFVGNQTVANTYTDCLYLRQGNYNNYTGASINYGTPTVHSNLVSPTPNSDINSHPYLSALFDKTFPFPMLKTGTGANEKLLWHYGDWVEATTMQTSLVYYEKYRDNNGVESYGYYAKTSLSTIGGEAETGANLWVINSLKDKPCIEDGYALMTIFQLSKFEYKLENATNYTTITTVETVAEVGTDIKTKAPLIQSDVTALFKKGEGEDALTQAIEKARVYRLPFHLQVAERTGTINNFFLKLNINGFVGEKKVIDNFNFYYCPDFAKNAVNPELGNTNIEYPKDPTGEENPVFVRSPRQLNGLSRYNYYWNEGNSGKKFYFKQETELNYRNYVTNYCGEVYDLMDTKVTNKYRNRPIGRPNDDGGGQFRNIYDGNFKKIIDYCCETYEKENQFTGLFGEVRMCTLKNIVLTASTPDGGGKSTAYVKSHFNHQDKDKTYVSSGTGALVGLVYVDQKDKHNDEVEVATVLNCVVSGYDVEVTTSNSPNREHAVGGLVGYNFGVIKNSSANSKTVIANPKSHSNTSYLGGLVGSLNGKGSIENCYAGGVLKSTSSGVIVGGLVGGFNSIYGYGSNDKSKRHQWVSDSYSHCTWNKDNLKNGTFYPCVPKVDQFDIKNCYYLTNSADPDITKKFNTNDPSEGKSYEELRNMAFTPSTTELSAFGKAANSYAWSTELKPKSYPFPAIVKDAAVNWKFVHYGDWYVSKIVVPTAIFTYYEKYSDDKGVESYGYQFAKTEGIEAYSDLKGNDLDITEAGYGVLMLAKPENPDKPETWANVWVNGKLVSFDTSNGTYTAEGGVYSLFPLVLTDVNTSPPARDPNVVLQYNKISNGVSTDNSQGLYVNFNFAATVSSKALVSTSASPTQVRTERQLRNLSTGVANEYYKMTHNIVISIPEGITGNLTNNGYTFDGGYAAGGGGVQYSYFKAPLRYFGKNGNYIYGLKAPLFDKNFGTVQNVALLGVNVTDNFAALVLANDGSKKSGTIENCFAQGDVTANGVAAGLVYSNSGTIKSSYFSGNVTAVSEAAGFVFTNSGEISNCYAVGKVQSTASLGVAGFVHTNSNDITNSYSAMRVTSDGTRYGFAGTGVSSLFTKCYWLKDESINTDVNDSQVTSMSLTNFGSDGNAGLFSKINGGGSWELNNTNITYPLDGNLSNKPYPYPKLKLLEHYGNWWT